MNPRIALEDKLRELLTRVLHGYFEEQRTSAVADYLRPRPPGLLGKRPRKKGEEEQGPQGSETESNPSISGTEDPQSHGFQWPP